MDRRLPKTPCHGVLTMYLNVFVAGPDSTKVSVTTAFVVRVLGCHHPKPAGVFAKLLNTMEATTPPHDVVDWFRREAPGWVMSDPRLHKQLPRLVPLLKRAFPHSKPLLIQVGPEQGETYGWPEAWPRVVLDEVKTIALHEALHSLASAKMQMEKDRASDADRRQPPSSDELRDTTAIIGRVAGPQGE